MPNGICHIEIVAGDISAAAKFYGTVFDWKTESMGAEYMIFSTGEKPGGGFSPPMPGVDKGVCIYIEVDDIEAMLSRIKDTGGEEVVPKTKISDEYGFYALFRDPQGNVIGLWAKD